MTLRSLAFWFVVAFFSAVGASAQAGAGSFPLTPVHGSAWVINDDDGKERELACLLFFEGTPGWMERVKDFNWGDVEDGYRVGYVVEGRSVEVTLDERQRYLSFRDERFDLRRSNVFLIRGVDEPEPVAVALGKVSLTISSESLAPRAVLHREESLRNALTGDEPIEREGDDEALLRKQKRGVDLFTATASKDHKRAFRIFEETAQKGLADGQYLLGFCYLEGRGADQDLAKATECFRQAAEQGHMDAQYKLAYSYRAGRGVERDVQEALRWYAKAGEQGDAQALGTIAYIHDTGEGVPKDDDEALRWFLRAAEAGDLTAQFEVAKRHAAENEHAAAVTAYEWARGVELQLTFIPPPNRAEIAELAETLRPLLSEEERAAVEERVRERLVRHAAIQIRQLGR